jgi:ferredoxin
VTYVIAEPCVDVKNGACVEVCPVDCIHTTPEDQQHYIDPDVCIECEQCVLVCPVEAVFLDRDLPEKWQQYVEINAAFFRRRKAAAGPVPPDQAEAMMRAAQIKAAGLGVKISVAVVDADGNEVAAARMAGADVESAVSAATRAAAAAAVFRAANAELTSAAVSRQLLGLSPAPAASARLKAPPGTIPILEGTTLIGVVGVAGGADEQDRECCRAAVAAYG